MSQMTLSPHAIKHALESGDQTLLSTLANATLGQAIDSACLEAGSSAYVRIVRGGVEYLVAIARPKPVADALKERSTVTGWLNLARGGDDLPYGRATVSVRAEDPTPEGKEARDERDRAKLSRERGAKIRQIMRERGCSRDDAAHLADKWNWVPGVSEPIPAGWTAPGDQVAPEFKAATGASLDPIARHQAMRQEYIESVKQLARSGRLQPTATKSVAVLATGLLRLWDERHPAPAR